MVPALYLSRQDLNDALKEGGRQNTAAVGRGSRELLIVAEVALSIMLLVGAGLLIRSLWQLQQVNPGFTAEHVLTMEVSLPIARYPEGDQMPFYQQLEDRIRALPGVAAVGAINMLPLSNNYNSEGVQIEEHPMPEGQGPQPQVRSVTPGYFRAMGIPLLRGRLFDTRDIESAQQVVIISESMARKYWPTSAKATVGKPDPGDVIGKRVLHRKQPRTVIGIVGDVKHLALNEDEVPMMYQPHTQQVSYHTMRLVIRANGDAAALTGQVRDELNRMDREVPLSQVATLSSSLDRTVAQPRMRATLLGFFAGLAMVLAAIGVYGVVAYLVGQRTQEIGVRRALGASAATVISMLMREAMRPVMIGIAIGIGGAVAMTRLLAAMLFEVSATDVMTYVVACGVLAVSALIASIVPARKALNVDPINAVRGQS
jgi:predicted permease